MYFKNLEVINLFNSNSQADQIALCAIHFPVLHEKSYSYVYVWNAHRIRPQKNRPNTVVGKPYMLYNNRQPPTEEWGISVHKEIVRG
jgi:hypothetical protein